MIYLFWIALGMIAYAYAGFPLLLWVRAKCRPRPFRSADIFPRVSVVIAAYNEARHIGKRLENLLSQDYPAECLEIVIASDGSSDGTNKIVEEIANPRVRLLPLPRQGKGPALNAAAAAATGEILVFSDANTHFDRDAIRRLVRPFADPSVGGVAGNQIYLRSTLASATADGERLYWNFDQWQKSLQSISGSVTSATGAIYAIRRNLYEPVPDDAMDDFYASTGVVRQGLRLVYADDARAYEPVAEAKGVEFSRKLRVITQGLQAVVYRRCLLNPLRHGFYSWQLFSHKVLRRVAALPLLILLIVTPWLWRSGLVYQVASVFEGLLVAGLLAAAGLRGTRFGDRRPWSVMWYFFMVNAAALAAVAAVLRGQRIRRWEPERHRFEPGLNDSAVAAAETLAP